MEASTTKVSSKGQVVIPANVRKAARLKKGEKILAIALTTQLVLKKILTIPSKKLSSQYGIKRVNWAQPKEDINAIIEEART